jgi:ATP-dependent Lon protease
MGAVSPGARELAMFPLGRVLFPFEAMALHVFEPRYRVMTRRCLEDGGELGIVLIERGHEVGGGEVRFDVGTRSRIVRADELPDGRFALQIVGLRVVRVVEWLPDDPHPRALVVDVPDRHAADDGDAAAAALARVRATLGEVVALRNELAPGRPVIAPPVPDDPARAAYELAAQLGPGPLDAQQLLAAEGTVARLDHLDALLHDAAELLRLRRGGAQP